MSEPLRLLQVEDSESDAGLIVRTLERAGYAVESERVEDAAEMRAALARQTWDVIIADYRLPRFSAPAALQVLRETGRDIPFLVVSGAIGEELAVQLMRSGAHDYVMKNSLVRLAPAVQREIREAGARRERRQAEQALRESEARERARATELEAVMDAVPVAMFISRDPECRRISGNRMTYELFRLPYGVNLSKSADEREKPVNFRLMKGDAEIPPGQLPIQTAARTRRPVPDYEFDLVFDDGARRHLLGNAVPLLDENGTSRGAVAAFLDVTEHKRIDERLRQAQKAESIGLLAGGIAHDFNNILTAVSGNLSLALDDLCSDCHVGSVLQVAMGAVLRAAGLTRQLLAYAGKGAFVHQPVSISEVAKDTVELLQASLPKNVELRSELASGLPAILTDPSQMQQVFVNLILNGAEAIGEKQPGTVVVRTSLDGDCVRIEVSDTGCGMDAETQKRIFDPFFTTKFMGRGLGLAAVQGIIRSLSGDIAIDSAPGQGARIQVRLPFAETAPRPDAEQRQDTAAATAAGAVLIVDDEPAVRKMAAALLRKRGLVVFEAANGRQAIDCLAANAAVIRAVVLDMAMPESHGHEALPAIVRLRPDIRVIVSSGYGDREVSRNFRGLEVRSFLPKPYSGDQLLAQVLAALK